MGQEIHDSHFESGDFALFRQRLDAETALREAQMRETVARYDVARQTYRLRYVTGRPVIDTVEELQ